MTNANKMIMHDNGHGDLNTQNQNYKTLSESKHVCADASVATGYLPNTNASYIQN